MKNLKKNGIIMLLVLLVFMACMPVESYAAKISKNKEGTYHQEDGGYSFTITRITKKTVYFTIYHDSLAEQYILKECPAKIKGKNKAYYKSEKITFIWKGKNKFKIKGDSCFGMDDLESVSGTYKRE